MFHDDVVVYGQALIESAELEKCRVRTPRIAVTPAVLELFRHELTDSGASEVERDFVRDEGDGPFIHILGSEWPFLRREHQQEQAGELHGDAIRSLFEEMRNGLPLRYQFAPNQQAKRKIEWMRDYVNKSLEEHCLGPEHRVVLPPSRSGLQRLWAFLTRKLK